jgi:hypothetical protein
MVATVARVAGPGGARSVVAESVLVKHQLLILNREVSHCTIENERWARFRAVISTRARDRHVGVPDIGSRSWEAY